MQGSSGGDTGMLDPMKGGRNGKRPQVGEGLRLLDTAGGDSGVGGVLLRLPGDGVHGRVVTSGAMTSGSLRSRRPSSFSRKLGFDGKPSVLLPPPPPPPPPPSPRHISFTPDLAPQTAEETLIGAGDWSKAL